MTVELQTYVREYPGDEAWTAFAEAYGCVSGDALEVAEAVVGVRFSEWLESPVPALDGHSPREILKNYVAGETIVRSLIMRTP